MVQATEVFALSYNKEMCINNGKVGVFVDYRTAELIKVNFLDHHIICNEIKNCNFAFTTKPNTWRRNTPGRLRTFARKFSTR